MRRKTKTPLWLDVLFGAAAGAVGTWLMSPAMQAISKVQSEQDKKKEQEGSWDENATVKTAKRLAQPLGIQVPEEHKEKAGLGVHWAYGMSWGAVYGYVAHKRPKLALWSGIAFGSFLWLFGDELMVPALRLAPPPQKFPVSAHLKALGAHLAYGTGADLGWRALHRASAAVL